MATDFQIGVRGAVPVMEQLGIAGEGEQLVSLRRVCSGHGAPPSGSLVEHMGDDIRASAYARRSASDTRAGDQNDEISEILRPAFL
jgi:hypothetical protein